MKVRADRVDIRAIAARFPAFSTVDVRHEPVEQGAYERELLRSPRPLLLKGLTKRWPAYDRWSFDFLAQKGAGIDVRVTRCIVEQSRTRRERWDLGAFVRALVDPQGPVTGGRNQAYLSYCRLFELLPELRADLALDRLFGPLTLRWPSAWIGPAGTISGLHCDLMPAVLGQIRGRKSMLLFAPGFEHRLYRSSKFEYGVWASEVDLTDFDFERYPRLRGVTPLLATLEEGDGLFIPRHWWHFVVSESPSVSVQTLGGYLRHVWHAGGPDLPKMLLHEAGLYRRGNCSCHDAS